MNKIKLSYIFREPQSPMICTIDGYFIGAETATDLEEKLQQAPLTEGGTYSLIDSRGEGWTLSVEHMAISPFSHKKRWTKKEIIRLFNQRINRDVGQGALYSEKSISSKRLDKIISDLVDLSSGSNMG